jgi:multiple sugar transport system substrate-binding protein
MRDGGDGARGEENGTSRRWLLSQLLGAGVVPGIAGCQQSSSPGTETSADAEPSEEPRVMLWHQETQLERQEAMLEIADRFERAHEWQIEVEAIESQEIHVEYQLRDARDTFTLGQFNTSQLDLFRGTDRPAKEAADGVVERIGDDRFWDAVLEQAETPGGYLGVPFFIWVQGPWYRESVFESYGLSDPPRSWDQLLGAAETLHDPADGQYGIVLGEDAETEYPTHCYTQLALANDTPLFSEDGEILFDTDAHVETLEFYRQLTEYTPPELMKPVPAFDAFVDERAHFGIYPTHLITYVWNSADDPEAAVSDLRFSGYMDESRQSAYGLMNYLVFSAAASSEQLSGAKQFAEFLLTGEDHANYLDWLSVQVGGFQPVFEAFRERDDYQQIEILKHVADTITQELIPEGITSIERFGGAVYDDYFPVIGEIEGQFLISKAIRRVLDGENARTVAEETADRMRELRG